MSNEDKRNKILEIFNDFYSEENVDFQDNKLIIHFPKLTVTNEYNKSIDITHLYVKLDFDTEYLLLGSFEIIRSEYTQGQYNSGYCHSHVTMLCGDPTHWKTPCLGTGPIRNTIAKLNVEFSEEMWKLFCFELKKYLETESIAGVPYIKLESVSSNSRTAYLSLHLHDNNYENTISSFTSLSCGQLIFDFVNYVIDKRPFKFNYCQGYHIAHSDDEIIIILSNLFIEFYNNSYYYKHTHSVYDLYNKNIIMDVKKGTDCYFKIININISSLQQTDTTVLNFKGNPIKLNIIKDSAKRDPNISIFINPKIATFVVKALLTLINTEYGK